MDNEFNSMIWHGDNYTGIVIVGILLGIIFIYSIMGIMIPIIYLVIKESMKRNGKKNGLNQYLPCSNPDRLIDELEQEEKENNEIAQALQNKMRWKI
jgi:uncharacterized membrane protein